MPASLTRSPDLATGRGRAVAPASMHQAHAVGARTKLQCHARSLCRRCAAAGCKQFCAVARCVRKDGSAVSPIVSIARLCAMSMGSQTGPATDQQVTASHSYAAAH